MLAPPKRVGIRPNGTSLCCPCQVLHLYLFAQNVSVRTAGRCVVEFIPLYFRTLCAALALGILPKPGEAKPGTVRSRKCLQETGRCPSLPAFFALPPEFQGAMPFFATTAHKRPNSVPLSRRYTDATRFTDGYKPSHNAKQGASLFWAAVRTEKLYQ